MSSAVQVIRCNRLQRESFRTMSQIAERASENLSRSLRAITAAEAVLPILDAVAKGGPLPIEAVREARRVRVELRRIVGGEA